MYGKCLVGLMLAVAVADAHAQQPPPPRPMPRQGPQQPPPPPPPPPQRQPPQQPPPQGPQYSATLSGYLAQGFVIVGFTSDAVFNNHMILMRRDDDVFYCRLVGSPGEAIRLQDCGVIR